MFNPAYKITPNLLKSITQIERARAVIENAPLLPLYERQFKSEATARKVHFSTAIEGNYLQIEEVKRILNSPRKVDARLDKFTDDAGQDLIARKRDIHEVINYRDVIKYVEKLTTSQTDSKHSITEKEIFDIHSILLRNIQEVSAGRYRVGTAVSINYLTGEKLYPYEDVGKIEPKMRELLDWYNSPQFEDDNPVVKAGVLHLETVRIHPFEEGNGRLARALATLSLSANGYDVGHFFCLDEYYDSNAADYYHFLGEGFSDLTKWLEYFALGMAIEFDRIKERVLRISKDAKIKEKTGQIFITERQEKVIEWLNNFGHFRNSDFGRLFPDISDDTVLRELNGLIDAGIVAKRGKTKSARYVLTG